MPGLRTNRYHSQYVAGALVLLAMAISVSGAQPRANDRSFPTQFYIVSMVTSDASPFWYHYILQVTAGGHDSIVRYIRIAPMHSMCANAITVKAAAVRLPDVSPADLVAHSNPCAIDSAALTRKLQRRIHTAAVDDTARFGIVAECGSREAVVRLPFPQQVNLERLRKRNPELARWWDLQHAIRERAFGTAEVFSDVSGEQEDHLQRLGESLLPELLSGRFDNGLDADCLPGHACAHPSFRDELREYVGPVGYKGHAPMLVQADEYHFTRYVPPIYPPLAMQAAIQGKVKLELSVDTKTGDVRHVTVILGHPIFLDAVAKAAEQWQFAPDRIPNGGQRIPADLVFEFRCPQPLQK